MAYFKLVVKDMIVSVPLRGRGHEIGNYYVDEAGGIRFPSPCGEEVMKYGSAASTGGDRGTRVSVPLRGRGHEISALWRKSKQ